MMTTEHGLVLPRHLRTAINTLRDRREYLQDKVAEKYDNDPIRRHGSYENAEIRALDLAIAALETEWDTAARYQRNLRKVRHLDADVLPVRMRVRPLQWEGP